MSKHKKHEEEEHENHERWLISYADFMTLLLALFIILYSMAKVDSAKYNAVAEEFKEQMGKPASSQGQPTAGGDPGAGLGEFTLPPGDIQSDEIDLSGSGKGTALEKIAQAIQSYVDENNLQEQVVVENNEKYVRIHIRDKMMFIPDSSRLIDPDNPILTNIEKAVAQVYPEIDYITFTGHTADVGENTLLSDQTSWRLSTERAITVLNRFIGYGLPQAKLSVQGFAHFQPIAENDTEDGRAQNRRVEITIFKEPIKVSEVAENAPVQQDNVAEPESSAPAESAPAESVAAAHGEEPAADTGHGKTEEKAEEKPKSKH